MFIVYGAGLVVVDLENLTPQSDMHNFNAIIRYHRDNLISDAEVYKHVFKDPDNPEAPGEERILAVVLVNYYGIRILDLNRKENEDPQKDHCRHVFGGVDLEVSHLQARLHLFSGPLGAINAISQLQEQALAA